MEVWGGRSSAIRMKSPALQSPFLPLVACLRRIQKSIRLWSKEAAGRATGFR